MGHKKRPIVVKREVQFPIFFDDLKEEVRKAIKAEAGKEDNELIELDQYFQVPLMVLTLHPDSN